MSANRLGVLPTSFKNLKKLKSLNLSSNSFEQIPAPVVGMNSLERLDMGFNKIGRRQERTTGITKGLKNLKVLILRGNKDLIAIPMVEYLSKVDSVEEIDISDCSLRVLTPQVGAMKGLKCLRVARNRLQALPDAICALEKLQTLDVEQNNLKQLPSSFYKLKKLQSKHEDGETKNGLILDGNPLRSPPPQVISQGHPGVISTAILKDADMLEDVVVDEVSSAVCNAVLDECLNALTNGGSALSTMKWQDPSTATLSESEPKKARFETEDSLVEDAVRRCMNECVDVVFSEVLTWVSSENVVDLVFERVIDWLIEDAIEHVKEDLKIMETVEDIAKEVVESEVRMCLFQSVEEGIRTVLGLWEASSLDQYGQEKSFDVGVAGADLGLPGGALLTIPDKALSRDVTFSCRVLDPVTCGHDLPLVAGETLVSDVIDIKPYSTHLQKHAVIKIPHAVSRFDDDREFVLKFSRNGANWRTVFAEDEGDGAAVFRVDRLGTLIVASRARTYEHWLKAGQQAVHMGGSEAAGVEVHLPADPLSRPRGVNFQVLAVDGSCICRVNQSASAPRGQAPSLLAASHIFNLTSRLIPLKTYAQVVLPLALSSENDVTSLRSQSSSSDDDSIVSIDDVTMITVEDISMDQVHVVGFSHVYNKWEDVTSRVNGVTLEGTNVSFRTKELQSYAVLCYSSQKEVKIDPTVKSLSRNMTTTQVSVLVFKRWANTDQDNFLYNTNPTRQMALQDSGDSISRMDVRVELATSETYGLVTLQAKMEGFEPQDGTPNGDVILKEGQRLHLRLNNVLDCKTYKDYLNFCVCTRRRTTLSLTLEFMDSSDTGTIEVFMGHFGEGKNETTKIPKVLLEVPITCPGVGFDTISEL